MAAVPGECMYSFRRWREKYGKVTLAALWDLFMVWVVIINLTLILFDLTYLWLRPTYFKWVPIVTRIYDPVLGIDPPRDIRGVQQARLDVELLARYQIQLGERRLRGCAQIFFQIYLYGLCGGGQSPAEAFGNVIQE